MLIIAGVKPGMAAFKQALGVRRLLQAEADLPGEEFANPFICFRESGDKTLAAKALMMLRDDYLRGAGACIAGERDAGIAFLLAAGDHSNADVQYAVGLSADDVRGRSECSS